MPRVKSAKNTSVKETKTKETKVKKTKSIKVDKKSTKVEKPKVKKTKKIVKNFTDEGIYWEADKLILRIFNDDDTHKNYIRTFMSDSVICINKDKIGKKTKYDNDKWGKIIDIKEDEKYLVIILEPILD
jgi:hypothetical protein